MKLTAALLTFLLTPTICFTSEPDFNLLSAAIFHCEGGLKAKTPYGVFYKGCDWKNVDYCRRVCINTLTNAFKRHKREASKLPFVSYLSRTYAPVGAKNDPKGLNQHWITNVNWFLKHPKEVLA